MNYQNSTSFRLTEEENEYLEKLKEKTGIKKSQCLRKMIKASFENCPVTFEEKDTFIQRKQLINEINKIGVNINQIVHNANSEYYTAYEKSKLFALMQKINDLLLEKL